jgi:hypothetical protein
LKALNRIGPDHLIFPFHDFDSAGLAEVSLWELIGTRVGLITPAQLITRAPPKSVAMGGGSHWGLALRRTRRSRPSQITAR